MKYPTKTTSSWSRDIPWSFWDICRTLTVTLQKDEEDYPKTINIWEGIPKADIEYAVHIYSYSSLGVSREWIRIRSILGRRIFKCPMPWIFRMDQTSEQRRWPLRVYGECTDFLSGGECQPFWPAFASGFEPFALILNL
jgi:hypothetical protein